MSTYKIVRQSVTLESPHFCWKEMSEHYWHLSVCAVQNVTVNCIAYFETRTSDGPRVHWRDRAGVEITWERAGMHQTEKLSLHKCEQYLYCCSVRCRPIANKPLRACPDTFQGPRLLLWILWTQAYARFKRRTLHAPNLIPIWVDTNHYVRQLIQTAKFFMCQTYSARKGKQYFSSCILYGTNNNIIQW